MHATRAHLLASKVAASTQFFRSTMSLSVAEDLLTPKHEALQAKRSIESGLLLAQLSPKGASLVRFLPTPPQEEGKPASVDAGWMRSHAEQVERMLPDV